MSTVILAEKPSQAMDIGKVIGIKSRGDGFLETVNGQYITWAIGHLLELAEPQEYDEAWGGRWAWAQLPMIPAQWKYQVNRKTSKQLTVIKGLLKKATHVIIATDAGREGELIAREVLEHSKYKGKISRFWTSSLVASDIKRALGNLKKGEETYPLYEAALARSHSDWMLGLSGTRAASLAANVRGDYFPLGRVKTPTLALVVKRGLAVKGFASKTYFELEASVRTKRGASFKMLHAPDEEHRITKKEDAEALKRKAAGHQGPLKVEKRAESEAPPLPYSLPALQKDANRILGFTAKNTLKVAQALYEKKAATYPRTDCQYLAESQVAEVPGVLDVVAKRFPSAVAALRKAGIVTRKSTFNDAKLVDHHGIIPTMLFVGDLEGAEEQLYALICQRYLQTLGPDCKYTATRVTMDANGVPFKATGKTINDPGWQALKLPQLKSEAED